MLNNAFFCLFVYYTFLYTCKVCAGFVLLSIVAPSVCSVQISQACLPNIEVLVCVCVCVFVRGDEYRGSNFG